MDTRSVPPGQSDTMADTTVTVDAGVCRFKTVITASMDDEMNITYKIKSECPAVRAMAAELGPMGVFDVISKPFSENIIYKSVDKLEHVCCPVPCAMIKAAEVAGDLALAKPVSFTFE